MTAGAAGGSSWYNRAAGAAVGQAGWMSGSWPAAAGQTGVYDETTSAMMSNIERESSDSFSSPGSSRQKLGINSNIYSLYQSKQTRDGSSSSLYMSPSLRSSSDAQETDPLAFTDQRQFSSPCVENSDKIINNDEDQKNVEPDSSTDAAQDNTDNDDHHDERMQRLLAEHAKILGVKTEEDKTRYRTAQEELTELMKLTNEKLFKSSAGVKSQVETSVDTDHCSSPPRPSFMISSNTGVRRRGRKPKHYSEILYELGQRGISITKTKQEQAGVSSGAPVNSGHEMVVSDSGSVSHKTSGQQLQCPHCNKILTTSVGLMYHIRLHTGNDFNKNIFLCLLQFKYFFLNFEIFSGEKPYTCEICSKSFATSSHYHYHIRSHSGEKPYR